MNIDGFSGIPDISDILTSAGFSDMDGLLALAGKAYANIPDDWDESNGDYTIQLRCKSDFLQKMEKARIAPSLSYRPASLPWTTATKDLDTPSDSVKGAFETMADKIRNMSFARPKEKRVRRTLNRKHK